MKKLICSPPLTSIKLIANTVSFTRTSTTFISLCFISLWCIVNIHRFAEYVVFVETLLNQPFPKWFNSMLVILVPVTEIIAMLLLLFNASRRLGLYLSFGLMLSYTTYIILMLSRIFGNIPCSCSSPVPGLSWVQHFWFNLALSLLAGMGIFLYKKKRHSDPGGMTMEGGPAKRQ